MKVLNDDADEDQQIPVHESDDEVPEKDATKRLYRKVKFENNKSPTRSPAKMTKAHNKSKQPRGSSLQKKNSALEDNIRAKNIEIVDLNRQLRAANESFSK